MERRSKVIIITVCVAAAVGIFAYSQYLSATHLSISILESKIIQRSDNNSLYNTKNTKPENKKLSDLIKSKLEKMFGSLC